MMLYLLLPLAALVTAALWSYLDARALKRITREVEQWIKNHSGPT